jgi:hypothetical protein
MPSEKIYIVQVVYTIDVAAPDAQEAREAALSELARCCESGRDMLVHVEARR